MKPTKDVGASVRARLLHLAREHGDDFLLSQNHQVSTQELDMRDSLAGAAIDRCHNRGTKQQLALVIKDGPSERVLVLDVVKSIDEQCMIPERIHWPTTPVVLSTGHEITMARLHRSPERSSTPDRANASAIGSRHTITRWYKTLVAIGDQQKLLQRHLVGPILGLQIHIPEPH